MDEQQQRILEDLSGVFEGELRFDSVSREIYSTDGSLYQLHPLGVAFPKHRDDVLALARYASEFDLPLVARGAGSGVAGGALGRGLIVDFSRHMTDIVRVDSETVRVQVGVVRDRLNQELRRHGRYFAPDPSNTSVTTIGGMLAVDAAGSRAVRVGSTRDHVQEIETVMADGTLLNAGVHPESLRINEPGRTNELIHRLAHILKLHRDLIQERQPPLIRNNSGYHLRSVLIDKSLMLPRLLIGSEGTLGLFTEATLHTTPLPAHRGVTLLLFGDLDLALDSVNSMIPLQPSACDLMDRRLLSLAREADERFSIMVSPNAEAALLVEMVGYSDRQVRDRLQEALAAVRRVDATVVEAATATDPDEVEFLWSLPYRVVPLLIRMRGETRPIPIVEDIAVPPTELREFLSKSHRIFQRHWVTASLYAHAASGQVHFRPFLGIPTAQNRSKIESLARELYEAALACGGTISGEHGNGLARTAFIRSQYGPLYTVFQKVKELFDPHNLLNPGKIISDDPHLTVRDLRPVPEPHADLVPLQLRWEPAEVSEAASRCNGCAICRVNNESFRMCPLFHAETSEQTSPRSKANMMRGLVQGTCDSRTFSSETFKELADSCFNCKQCQMECPSNVDIPSLAIEIKAQHVAATGLSGADWILSRAHSFGGLGCSFAPITNWVLGNPTMRWLVEKTLGISRQRRLPGFARRTFLKSAPRLLRRLQRSGKRDSRVVYFVDHFANFHDPTLAEALVRILHHNGIDVVIPAAQVASGMAMISAGDLDSARELAQTNVDALAESARDGLRILCTEPTAALCLKHEYPRILNHPDVDVVADQVVEAGTFLRGLHAKQRLGTDFQDVPLKLGYHLPCHLRFLETQSPLAELIQLIPGIELERIQQGCSGMAGAFGVTAANFEKSVAIGAGLIAEMQRPDFTAGATECSSCQLQMLQNSSTPTAHPIKILALAYGLMPELKRQLNPIRRGLRV